MTVLAEPVATGAPALAAAVSALAQAASLLASLVPVLSETVIQGSGRLDQFGQTTGGRLLISAIVAVCALGGAYLVRRSRAALADELVPPLAIDLFSAVLTITIAVLAVYSVAKVWGQVEALENALGALSPRDRAPQIAVTVVVLIAVQVLAAVAHRLLQDISRESNAVSDHEREVAYRVLQLTLWVAAIVVLLGVWNFDVGGLLVGAGFLGIVVGLAAQQTLGSLFAGLVLMFSRPFEVGDWVEVGQDEGIVTDITLMNTSIQAFDGEYVVIPNDVISSQTVKNRTRKGRIRIEVDVGVDYTADVERAREIATAAVADLDIVMDVPRPESVVKSFDESAVTIGVRGWIEHPSSRRRWRARTGMVRSIKRRFAEEGIKIPYPQRELSGREEHGGLRVADGQPAGGPTSETGEAPPDDVGAPPEDGAGPGTPDGGSSADAPDGADSSREGDR